jgi:hypothetical protein
MLMPSSVGIAFSSSDLAALSMQIGMQCTGGVMKPVEDRSVLSFDSIVSSTLGSRSIPRPCSSHVVSFSPVYSHAEQARSWRG